MKTMPRSLALLGGLCLTVAAATPAVAQDASPSTGPAAVEPAGAAAAVEGELQYVDAAGVALGIIALRQVSDPFTEFDPNSPPPEGQRFVQLVATFEAAEDQTMPAEPGYVALQDADGFLYWPSYLPRLPDALPPDLQSQTLSPFDRVSGSIGYTLPANKPIVRILYLADGSRLFPIAELGGDETPPVGSPRVVRGADGVEQGSVTIRELVDPFTGHEPSQPAPEGQRYIQVAVAFEAAEGVPMLAETYGLQLVDDAGVVYFPTYVPRPPGQSMQDLDRQALSPGDRISGVAGYVVPVDAVITRIVYAPEYDRYLRLADLATGG